MHGQLAARYKKGNLDNSKLRAFWEHNAAGQVYDDYLYDIFSDLEGVTNFLPKKLFSNKDEYDATLTKLFDMIINSGHRYYNFSNRQDSSLTESNFLKNDSNYYAIIKSDWTELSAKIDAVYCDIATFLENI